MYEEDARTQKQLVIDHMNRYGSITSKEAFDEYGISRLAAVVWRLINEDGFKIESKNEVRKNRRGRTIQYARYSRA